MSENISGLSMTAPSPAAGRFVETMRWAITVGLVGGSIGIVTGVVVIQIFAGIDTPLTYRKAVAIASLSGLCAAVGFWLLAWGIYLHGSASPASRVAFRFRIGDAVRYAGPEMEGLSRGQRGVVVDAKPTDGEDDWLVMFSSGTTVTQVSQTTLVRAND